MRKSNTTSKDAMKRAEYAAATKLKDLFKNQPCRQATGQCAPGNGDCLRCLAAMGEACKAPRTQTL